MPDGRDFAGADGNDGRGGHHILFGQGMVLLSRIKLQLNIIVCVDQQKYGTAVP